MLHLAPDACQVCPDQGEKWTYWCSRNPALQTSGCCMLQTGNCNFGDTSGLWKSNQPKSKAHRVPSRSLSKKPPSGWSQQTGPRKKVSTSRGKVQVTLVHQGSAVPALENTRAHRVSLKHVGGVHVYICHTSPNTLKSPGQARNRAHTRADRHTDRQTDGRTDGRTASQTDGRTDRQTDTETHRQPARQPGSQAVRQEFRQTNKKINKQTNTLDIMRQQVSNHTLISTLGSRA